MSENKPREFWIDERNTVGGMRLSVSSVAPRPPHNAFLVREVLPTPDGVLEAADKYVSASICFGGLEFSRSGTTYGLCYKSFIAGAEFMSAKRDAEIDQLKASLSCITHDGVGMQLEVTRLNARVEAMRARLDKIANTQDTAAIDLKTGGPSRIALSESRNRRILEAREALANDDKLKGSK